MVVGDKVRNTLMESVGTITAIIDAQFAEVDYGQGPRRPCSPVSNWSKPTSPVLSASRG